jgi:hypothetical protein
MSNDVDITESIRELLKFNQGEQALSALKYGIVPFIGYVLRDPTKKHLSLLVNLFDVLGDIYVALDIDMPEVTDTIIEELKHRAKEIETGVVKEIPLKDDQVDKGFIITTKEEKTDG